MRIGMPTTQVQIRYCTEIVLMDSAVGGQLLHFIYISYLIDMYPYNINSSAIELI